MTSYPIHSCRRIGSAASEGAGEAPQTQCVSVSLRRGVVLGFQYTARRSSSVLAVSLSRVSFKK